MLRETAARERLESENAAIGLRMQELERCAGDSRDTTEQLLQATEERTKLERQLLDVTKEKSQLTDEFAIQVRVTPAIS